jgi:TonB family protein
MKLVLLPSAVLCAFVLCALSPAYGQDPQLREEAVRLLEKADAISTSPKLPNLERTDTFRVYGSDSIQEGSFSRVVIQGTGRRDEYTLGGDHLVNVFTREQLAVAGTVQVLPAAMIRLLQLTPIDRVRFDHEDVIHSITNREVDGRPARCIQFDTIGGNKTDSNELCVDSVNGTLVAENLRGTLIENSDFFAFAGALMPGKIRYSEAGVLKMEITQTMTELTDATPNLLAAPPNAQIRKMCTTYRRAFGVSMPQPKPGNGGGEAEIMVRGIIGADGRVRDAIIQSSERPDLNAEALSLIRQWVFTPALCNGAPNALEASFALHFEGR